METYKFIKEASGWYIDLPSYLEQGGSKGDLAMVAGADTMLDIMAEGNSEVTLAIDTKPFEQADHLELTEICSPTMGGGHYLLHTYKHHPIAHKMWLCSVTNFVFGYLPEHIYVQKL
jgi:hypothetical protein